MKYEYLKIELKFNKKNKDQIKLYKALKERVRKLKEKDNSITVAGEIKAILYCVLKIK